MTQVLNPGDVRVLKSDGSVIPYEPPRSGFAGGWTLLNGTTYYALFNASDAVLTHISAKWDAALIITNAQLEDCELPRFTDASAKTADVSDVSVTKGDWMEINPTAGVYVSNKTSDGTTGGSTVTNCKFLTAGGTAGGISYHVGNLGTGRLRMRLDIGATGGLIRFGARGKH